MLSNILNLLSAKIEIQVLPDRFVFKRNNEIISLKTKIYLSDNSTKAQVLGIGDEFIPTQSNICIELFQENKNGLLPNLAKSECLDTFFRHAFRLITRKSAMVRPLVVIKNSKSLDKILCGYQDSILLSAAINAGARKCIFENWAYDRITCRLSGARENGGCALSSSVLKFIAAPTQLIVLYMKGKNENRIYTDQAWEVCW